MKKFRALFEAPGAPAADNKVIKDDEKEVKGYKPRSKGDEDFIKDHAIEKVAHPVGTEAQFTGDISKGNPEEHKGGKKHAAGETVVKQGSSKIKESFSSFIEDIEDGND